MWDPEARSSASQALCCVYSDESLCGDVTLIRGRRRPSSPSPGSCPATLGAGLITWRMLVQMTVADARAPLKGPEHPSDGSERRISWPPSL